VRRSETGGGTGENFWIDRPFLKTMRNSAAAAAMTVEIERDGSFDLVPDTVRILGEMGRDARSDGGRNTAIAPEHLIKSSGNNTR
jgi:hypothetical protein